VYAPGMKRLQILIDEDLAEALGREARATGASMGALMRRYAREALRPSLPPLPPLEQDPLWRIVGMSGAEPADIDDTVYG